MSVCFCIATAACAVASQGRLPIRVELRGLTADDFKRILTEPDCSMIYQQQVGWYRRACKTEQLCAVCVRQQLVTAPSGCSKQPRRTTAGPDGLAS